LGITILIKIQTDQQNEPEKDQTQTDPPTNPNQPEPLDTHPLPQNPTPTETTNKPPNKDTPKCAHYFGYVSSGEKIPEDCLTCSKLLNCLTSKGGITEEE
jgi:hypothetical protein